MKIVNIQTSKSEDHSIHTKKYGAGAVFAKHARLILNNGEDEFWDIGPLDCFKNIRKDEKPERCLFLRQEEISAIRLGCPINQVLPHPIIYEADIFIFNNDDLVLNLEGLKATQALWMAFVNQTCHPKIPHCLIYSEFQNPRFDSSKTRLHKIKIGKPVSSNFYPTIREDFLFQCTRNDSVMDTIHTVELCNHFGIRGYFAGPILNDYPLLERIDNKNTFYLGEISEAQKIWYSRHARLYGCIQNWDTIFSLSAVEALGQGTPIIARKRGCFNYLIDENKDGFYYNDTDESFLCAWNNTEKIDQLLCYAKGCEYSDFKMVESFRKVFQEILK